MLYRLLIKLGISLVALGFCVTLVGYYMNGEIGKVTLEDQQVYYSTSFDQIKLIELPEWVVE